MDNPFKWRHYRPEIILLCVRWHLQYALSYRDLDEGKVEVRPSETRIREATALDGGAFFVVTCPKDITMYRDAVKTTGHEDGIVVKDLIELVYEAL